MSDVTQILERVERGDGKAAEELLPLVYDELRRLAAYKMAQEPSGHAAERWNTDLTSQSNWMKCKAYETHLPSCSPLCEPAALF
jgi:hypothetical protein